MGILFNSKTKINHRARKTDPQDLVKMYSTINLILFLFFILNITMRFYLLGKFDSDFDEYY